MSTPPPTDVESGDEITLELNGEERALPVEPGQPLVEALRATGLTGTKNGCEVGKCGACTVLVDGQAVKSCLVPAHQAVDTSVTTIEGLADDDGSLHPVQDAFIEEFGLQCGYCTPGFVMAAVALLDENSSPSRDEIRGELKGNLCRCTGYTKIFDAVEHAAEQLD
jgi:carbon-monoxide dehydrogenase small subunit